MMGGAASGSGSGAGSTVFNPVAQPAANAALGNIFQPLADLSANAGAGTPAGINYPMAQSAVYNDIVNSPFANQAIWGSDQAAQNAFNIAAPQAFGGAQALGGAALGGLPFAGQALSQGFDPRYGAAISGIENNPYYGQALGGAQAAAGMGAQGANAIQGLGGQIGGTVDPLLSSGFDPRAALFNRTEGRLMDQTNAINAMSGVAGTPYGASVTANALGNFDIDWQNQQLARQAQATGAAGSAANTAGGLYGAAPGLMASSAGLPSGVYTSNIGQIIQALDQRNKAGALGAAGFGSLLGSGGQGLGRANDLNLSGIGAQNTYGAAPYNTQAGIGANALTNLTNLTQLGNNQFALPNQEIGNLMQYMGLGQNASQLSGQLGQMGFNQTAQGIGGGLSGINSLFGNNGLFGGGGGLGGLGGAATGGAFGAGDFGGGGAALGIADQLGLGAAPLAADAGGGGLAAALPLALSA
jgi:hypothetical protein